MFRQRKYLFAVAALVLVFAGCKGESPTAPTSNPPTTTIGGGTPPPSTVNIALTAAKSSLQVNSSTVITATVTDANNQPVPNGTAVEFDTNLGTFTEANAQTVIRTTTAGAATVTLASALVGTATVSAIVANVKKTVTVSFTALPTNPPPLDTAPAITGITPNFGRPQGGETVTITGKNFRTPLRVFFDFGPGTTPKDATIISSTATTVQVLTPSVDLGASAQQLTATVKLVNEVGTPNEIVVTGPTFTYQLAILTPKITTVSPASGPIDGGTRVVIYGEGFQSKVQVFFGAAEVQPIQILFNQITVITPTARDATPDASGAGTGPVSVRVINIDSATQVTLPNAFRYVPKMAITAVGPTEGPVSGGTRVRIDGTGFNDPVAVTIGGIAAQPISVSGTEIIAVTAAPLVTGCADVTGPISVTNVDNGDSATAGVNFTFRVPKPVIISATNVTVGQQTTVVVFNGAPGIPRLTIGDVPLTINSATTDSTTGLTTFQATVPTTSSTLLHTQACAAGGTVPVATPLTITFANATTGCSATLPNGITLSPILAPAVTVNPASFTPFTSSSGNPSAVPPVPPAPSTSQSLNIVNNSPEQLTATSITPSNCGQFNLGGSPLNTVLSSCDIFQVTARYTRTAPSGASDTCTLAITFTDAQSQTITKTLVLTGNVQ
ncbi:MAG TPA: IPT/TIG domain-containing protein [Thermoanaerobaculia bacterium]